MDYRAKADMLRQRIEATLSPLICGDYVLLELPYYRNIGDILIWEGERNFLGGLPYKCLYRASLFSYNPDFEIPAKAIILLQGGGNFGDLWKRSQEFRLRIIERYPDNNIIILPQTVYYEDEEVMREEAARMAKHPRLTLCARDKRSFDQLFRNFQNTVLLLPDMAFCISPDSLLSYKKKETDRTLFLKRRDKEWKECPVNIPQEFPVSVSDWPTYERRLAVDFIMDVLAAVKRRMEHSGLPVAFLGRMIDWYAGRIYRKRLLRLGVEFVSSYRNIYTTRLHVAVLSFLLEKECFFLDNSYGKNSQFYHTWLEDVPGIHMIE